jgi:tRNA pseudouridine55 synthase
MFLLIDKPKGITSHDVIDRVREVTGEKRVGHAGTLDPNATGLLVVGVGRESTKKLGVITQGTKKKYEAEVFLGEERDTDDVEGKIRSTRYKAQNGSQITKSKVQAVLKEFVGEQMQVPPAYSAIKINGKKAYQLARRGGRVRLEPRKVVIYFIELTKYKYPLLSVVCSVSSGTYIRSLTRDIGRKLGCGGYLENLRRTKVGKFSVKDAVGLDSLSKKNWKGFAISGN